MKYAPQIFWKRRKRGALMQQPEYLAYECPVNISDVFKISNSERYELIRSNNNNKLMLSKYKTNSMERTFAYAAAKVWNQSNDK